MKKEYYRNQEVLFRTNLFGKDYFWMKDGDGVIYLVKAKPEEGISVSSDGTRTKFNTGRWVPDFS